MLMATSGKTEAKILELPKFLDLRGNLSFFENNSQIPFEIKRAYWIYDVPGGEMRGGHAYKSADEFIVALSGSFDVVTNDGNSEKIFPLNRSYYGVFVPRMTWRELKNFSSASLALVVSSAFFSEDDYIREFSGFLSAAKKSAEKK